MLKVYYLKRLGAFELSAWYFLCTIPDIASLMEWASVEELTRIETVGVEGEIYQCENGVYYQVIKEF